jgi:hypothetical protein
MRSVSRFTSHEGELTVLDVYSCISANLTQALQHITAENDTRSY